MLVIMLCLKLPRRFSCETWQSKNALMHSDIQAPYARSVCVCVCVCVYLRGCAFVSGSMTHVNFTETLLSMCGTPPPCC